MALDPECHVDDLSRFAKDRHWCVRYVVARHKKSSVFLLNHLANDDVYEVRQGVAGNQNTPVLLLEKLGQDENWEVRAKVAENKNTPLWILEKLGQDQHSEVRLAIAKNEKTPVYLLEFLSRDECYLVREAVAKNKNTPAEVLVTLSNDPTVEVRCVLLDRVCKNIDGFPKLFFARLLEEANPSFIKQLLEFVSLPLGVLQLGLYSKNKEIVQQFIIQQTTRQTLQIIAEKQRSETS